MAKSLTERIDAEIASLQAEKDRIKTQADDDLAIVNARLTKLRDAKAALTVDALAVVATLAAAGFRIRPLGFGETE